MTVDVGTAVRIAIGLLEVVERDPLLAIHTHTTYLLRTRLKHVNTPTSNTQVELGRDEKPKGPLKEGGSDVIAGPGGVTLVVPKRSHGDTHNDQTYRTAHVAGADNPGHSQLHSNSHTTITYGGERVGNGAPLGPPSGDGTYELHSSKSAHARSHSPTAAYNGGGRGLESRNADRERGRDRDRDRDRDRERRRSNLQSRDGSGYRTGLRVEHQESTRTNIRSRERSSSRGRSRSRERSRSRSRAESSAHTPLSKRTSYDSEDTHAPTPSHSYAREQTRRSSTDEHSRGRDSHQNHVHRPQQDADAAEGTRSRRTCTPSRDGGQSREGARTHSRTATHTPTASLEDIRESLRVGMRSHAHAYAQTHTRTHTHHAEHTDLGYDRRDSTNSTGSSTRHHERRYTGARASPPGTRTHTHTHTERSTRVSRTPRVDPPSRSHSRTDSRSHSRTRNRADTPTVRGSSRASSRSGHHEGPVREDRRADTPTHHNTRTHTPTGMYHGRGGGLRTHTPTTTEYGPHSHVRTLEEMRRLARETVRGETWLDGDAQLDRKVQYLREAAEKLQRHSDDRDRDRDTHRESEREEALRVQAHVAVDPRVYGPYGRDDTHTHTHVPTIVHVHRPQEESEHLTSARSSSGTRAIDPHRDPHRDAREHGGGKTGGRKSAVRVMRRVSDSTAEEGEPHVRRRHEHTRREGDGGENRRGVISTGDGIRKGGAHRREARKKQRTRKNVVLVTPYRHTMHATSEPQVYSDSGAEEVMRGHRHADTADTTHTAHTHETHTHAPTSHDTHTHTGKAHESRTHTTQPRSSAENGGGGHSDMITPTRKSHRIPKDVLEYIAASQSALNEPASTDTDEIPTRTREQASTRHMSDNEILAYSPPLPRTPTAERVNFSTYDEGLTDAYRRVSSQVGGDMQTHTHTHTRTHTQKPTLVHLPSHVSVHTPTERTPQRTTFSHAPAITLTPAPRPLQRPPRDPSHTPARTRTRARGYEEPAPTVTAYTKDNRNSRDSRGNKDTRHTAPPSQYASMTSWTFTDAGGMSTERIRALALTLPNITHINTVHVRGWDEALYAAVLDNWPLLTDWDLGIFPAVSDSGRLLTCLSQSAVEALSVDGEIPSALHSPVLRVLSAHETVSLRLLLAGNSALVELTLSWQVVSERLVSLSLQVLRVKQVSNPGALIGCPNLTELGVDSLTEKTFCTSAAVLSVTCHKVSNANMDRFPRVNTLRLGRYASLEEGFISRRVARLEMDSESESGLPLKYYLPMLHTLSCGFHDMRALSFMSLTTLTLRCFVDESALKQTIANCPCLESIYLRQCVPWTYKPYSSVDLWQIYAETKLSRYNVTLFVDRSYESSASQGFLSLLREGRVGYTGM
ncbi:hypothetical protein SARC_09874 [Sphaeroforma arctica JP610]|uniref:Uncharacterized protein n=1 Tax=Sphaeroforma arctica JP610 TaxID=667725 RepID=A0A0L0FLL2_9EUKA|nr:hypothetical protein SARC_09874 [Sphaeroforma arctica JP610]KNC77667.1 hypothetical protein SARC_09874 [Sphaeroforma arctica JP610]|eukprot:XP_014151569.1 hypothetical protein SARC_09874 [Sphaeroforma arctica JP610]